ncbi:hypothetical protein Tco_0478838 [Tanacetum coccineum]
MRQKKLRKEYMENVMKQRHSFDKSQEKHSKHIYQSGANHVWLKANRMILREMLDCQKIQYDLLKVEQERMKATQEAHTEKIDQVIKSQSLLEDDLKVIQGATQKVLDLLQRRHPAV